MGEIAPSSEKPVSYSDNKYAKEHLTERQYKSMIYMYLHDYPMSAIMDRFVMAQVTVNEILRAAGITTRKNRRRHDHID